MRNARKARFLVISVLILCMLTLAACTRVIRSPADELTMYRWLSDSDNGSTAELSFDGDDGCLTLSGGGVDLTIRGVYAVTDDSLVICDRASGADYRFGYQLYGDRIELSNNGSAITLHKDDGG